MFGIGFVFEVFGEAFFEVRHVSGSIEDGDGFGWVFGFEVVLEVFEYDVVAVGDEGFHEVFHSRKGNLHFGKVAFELAEDFDHGEFDHGGHFGLGLDESEEELDHFAHTGVAAFEEVGDLFHLFGEVGIFGRLTGEACSDLA